jgi:hypothetical protein
VVYICRTELANHVGTHDRYQVYVNTHDNEVPIEEIEGKAAKEDSSGSEDKNSQSMMKIEDDDY